MRPRMMLGAGLALALVCDHAVAAPHPEPASALDPESAPADPESLAGEVIVEVAPDMIQGQNLRAWVHERSLEALERRNPLPVGDRILIEIAGTPRDYVLEVHAIRRGEALPGEGEPVECKCTTDDLLARVGDVVDQAVDRLERAALAERAQAERERVARERAEASERVERARLAELERRKRLAAEPYRPRPLGAVGGVAIGLGGAMVITGVGLAWAGQGRDTSNDLLRPHDLRPSGFTVLGIGLASLATGVGLLVADVVRCKRDRVRCGMRGPLIERALRPGRWRTAWR